MSLLNDSLSSSALLAPSLPINPFNRDFPFHLLVYPIRGVEASIGTWLSGELRAAKQLATAKLHTHGEDVEGYAHVLFSFFSQGEDFCFAISAKFQTGPLRILLDM